MHRAYRSRRMYPAPLPKRLLRLLSSRSTIPIQRTNAPIGLSVWTKPFEENLDNRIDVFPGTIHESSHEYIIFKNRGQRGHRKACLDWLDGGKNRILTKPFRRGRMWKKKIKTEYYSAIGRVALLIDARTGCAAACDRKILNCRSPA